MEKLKSTTMKVGALILLASLFLQLKNVSWAPYTYLAGALMFAYIQIIEGRIPDASFTVRRLRRQQIFGALLLTITGVLMIFMHRNEWMVCLTIATVFELYTAFRIPSELEKDK